MKGREGRSEGGRKERKKRKVVEISGLLNSLRRVERKKIKLGSLVFYGINEGEETTG